MYCPNCGNKNSEDQNFCRSCGLGLEKIAQSLSEQLPTVAVENLQQRKDRLERLGVASLSVFGLGILGFLIYGIFSKLMITQGPLVAILAVLAAIVFMGSGLVSVILFAKAKELKEAPAKRQLDPSVTNTTARLLEPNEQPVFSIAERTTDLLAVDRARKTGSTEDREQ